MSNGDWCAGCQCLALFLALTSQRHVETRPGQSTHPSQWLKRPFALCIALPLRIYTHSLEQSAYRSRGGSSIRTLSSRGQSELLPEVIVEARRLRRAKGQTRSPADPAPAPTNFATFG